MLPTLEALGYVSVALVAGVGGMILLGGGELFGTVISLGLIVTFIAYAQRFNQPIDVSFGRTQDVKCQTLRRLLTDARQAFEFVD